MKLRFLVVAFSGLLLQGTAVKANLQNQYNQRSSVSSSQAQYFGTRSNLFGDTWNVSYYVDGKGNIYSFREGYSGASFVGVIGKRYSATSNTCLFGINIQCMGNTMTTITQYGIDYSEGYKSCGLYKYSSSSANIHSSPLFQGDGSGGNVSREEIGVCQSALAIRGKEKAKKAEEARQKEVARRAAAPTYGQIMQQRLDFLCKRDPSKSVCKEQI